MALLFEIDFANNLSWDGLSLNPLNDKGSVSLGYQTAIRDVGTLNSASPIITQPHRGGAMSFNEEHFVHIFASAGPPPVPSENTLLAQVVWNGQSAFNNYIISTLDEQGIECFVPLNSSDLGISYYDQADVLTTLTVSDFFKDTEYNWHQLAVTVNWVGQYIAVYKDGDFIADFAVSNMKAPTTSTSRRMNLGSKNSANSGGSRSSFELQFVGFWDEALTADDILANYQARSYRFREDEIVMNHDNSSGEISVGLINFTRHIKVDWVDGTSEEQQAATGEPNSFFINTIASETGKSSFRGQMKNIGSFYGFKIPAASQVPISQTNKFISYPKLFQIETFLANGFFEYDFTYLTTHKTDWTIIKIDMAGRNFDVTGLSRLGNLTKLLLGFLSGTSTGIVDSYPPSIQEWQIYNGNNLVIDPNVKLPNSMFDVLYQGQFAASYDVTEIVEKLDGSAVRRFSWVSLAGQPATTPLIGNIDDYPTLLESWYILIDSNTISGNVATFLNRPWSVVSNLTIKGDNTISGDLSTVDWSGKSISDAVVITGENTITGILSAAGTIPPVFQTFQITGQNTLSGDLEYFRNANRVISIGGKNTINTYSPGTSWHSSLEVLVIKGAAGANNNFSISDTDALLNDIWNAVEGVTNNGTIDIYSLGRTAASDLAFSGLTGQGWQIILTINT